jgi:hypothetical protein
MAKTMLSTLNRTLCRFLLGGCVASFGLPLAMSAEPAAAPARAKKPSLEQVTATIDGHFREMKDYEPGDLISRTDVQDALDRVETLGWKVPQRAALEKLVLPESAFLVTQLRTKQGVPFMRKIARYPQGYDRLDRLSSISGGRRIVTDLIRGKGGYELIEYLSTSQGGANLGQMLGHAKDGSNMNKPTGRLYTVDALVKTVEKLYRWQAEKQAATALP